MSTILLTFLDPGGNLSPEFRFDPSLAQPIVIERPSVPSPADETFVVDPQGRIADTWPDLVASAGAVQGDTLYFPKRDVGPLAAEWWGLAPDGTGAVHLLDRSRGGNDAGWWLETGGWFARDVHTGMFERWVDVLHEVDGSSSRRFIYTLHYEVGTCNGQPAWRVLYDPRDEDPRDGPEPDRREGSAEMFTFSVPPGETRRRWRRWTDLKDRRETPGDVLEIARDDRDGHLRDYLLPPPARVPFVACPRPTEVSVPVRVRVVSWGQQEPEIAGEPVVIFAEVEAPGAAWVSLHLNGQERHRATPPRRLTYPVGPGTYRLVVTAHDSTGRVLDRTGSPRIVTVLAAPVEPEPEPDRPAGTIQSAHATYLRVRPDGVVDFGGEAPGPWEAVSTEAQS
jgi:hypothetical protein